MKPKNVSSRVSYTGLLLAIVLPPVGLIVSIAALIRIKQNKAQGKKKAIFGIVWGGIFTLLILLLVGFVGSRKNAAKAEVQPLLTQVEQAGGKKICENGDDGYGFDNTLPWYDVYYEVPDNAQLTDTVKADAAQLGYVLTKDPVVYDGGSRNAQSNYLSGTKGENGLIVSINRDISLTMYCDGDGWGSKKTAGNGKAIINMHLSLPSIADQGN